MPRAEVRRILVDPTRKISSFRGNAAGSGIQRSEVRTFDQTEPLEFSKTNARQMVRNLLDAAGKDPGREAIFFFDLMPDLKFRFIASPRERSGEEIFHKALLGNYTNQGYVVSGIFHHLTSGDILVLGFHKALPQGEHPVNEKTRYNHALVSLARTLIFGGLPPDLRVLGSIFTEAKTGLERPTLGELVALGNQERLGEINWHQDLAFPSVELSEAEIKEYLGPETLKRFQKQDSHWVIRELDPGKDQNLVEIWKKSFKENPRWFKQWKRNREDFVPHGFPYFPKLIEPAIGLVSIAQDEERLMGWLGVGKIYSDFDPLAQIFTYALAIPKGEVYFKNIGAKGNVKGIPDLLFDYVIKAAKESGLVQNSIFVYPSTPGAAAFIQRQGFEKLKEEFGFTYKRLTAEYFSRRLSNKFNRRAEAREAVAPETLEVAKAAGGIFEAGLAREKLIRYLRSLRRAYREREAAVIPDYLKAAIEEFRSRGLEMESAVKEAGAEILVFDHEPTESETAALIFSLARKPSSRARMVVLSDREISKDYLSRIRNSKDIHGRAIGERAGLFQAKEVQDLKREFPALLNQLTAWISSKVTEESRKEGENPTLAARKRIVVTMEEELAERLGSEIPEISDLLYYGIKRVRYRRPEHAFQYSALQSAALSLAERDYQKLTRFEQRVLEDHGQGLFVSRYSGIEGDWQAAWLAAEARILQAFARAA